MWRVEKVQADSIRSVLDHLMENFQFPCGWTDRTYIFFPTKTSAHPRPKSGEAAIVTQGTERSPKGQVGGLLSTRVSSSADRV